MRGSQGTALHRRENTDLPSPPAARVDAGQIAPPLGAQVSAPVPRGCPGLLAWLLGGADHRMCGKPPAGDRSPHKRCSPCESQAQQSPAPSNSQEMCRLYEDPSLPTHQETDTASWLSCVPSKTRLAEDEFLLFLTRPACGPLFGRPGKPRRPGVRSGHWRQRREADRRRPHPEHPLRQELRRLGHMTRYHFRERTVENLKHPDAQGWPGCGPWRAHVLLFSGTFFRLVNSSQGTIRFGERRRSRCAPRYPRRERPAWTPTVGVVWPDLWEPGSTGEVPPLLS
ncbi:uncharacterized protein LOC122208509 [Panthera leo]|uniref:uncharacterized protein LOC122208509 n=1 Tax=Panthera leo TaxID=9689 RepID=UPI001C6965BE|nr:uncharacterized protein LOC122208509 [Panthera leo]